jgi:hypothetical protein
VFEAKRAIPIAWAVLVAGGILACGPRFEAAARAAPVQAPSAASAPSANPWSAMTREILVQNCSPCHRGDLPNAVPRALLVYDLSRSNWSESLTPEQLGGLIQRVQGTREIPEWDRFTVDRFVRCARDRECEVP